MAASVRAATVTGQGNGQQVVMSDISDLGKRVGQIEATLGQTEDKGTAVLKELQNRLNTIQSAVVQKNAQIEEKNAQLEAKDHDLQALSTENTELKEMVQRLTSIIEKSTADALWDQLKNLDTQIGTLAELTDTAANGAAQPTKVVDNEKPAPDEAAAQTPEPPAAEPEPVEQAEGEAKKSLPFGLDDRKWIRDVIDGASKATAVVGGGAKANDSSQRNVDAYGPEPTPLPQSRLAVIHGGDLAAEPAK